MAIQAQLTKHQYPDKIMYSAIVEHEGHQYKILEQPSMRELMKRISSFNRGINRIKNSIKRKK